MTSTPLDPEAYTAQVNAEVLAQSKDNAIRSRGRVLEMIDILLVGGAMDRVVSDTRFTKEQMLEVREEILALKEGLDRACASWDRRLDVTEHDARITKLLALERDGTFIGEREAARAARERLETSTPAPAPAPATVVQLKPGESMKEYHKRIYRAAA